MDELRKARANVIHFAEENHLPHAMYWFSVLHGIKHRYRGCKQADMLLDAFIRDVDITVLHIHEKRCERRLVWQILLLLGFVGFGALNIYLLIEYLQPFIALLDR
jgi:hypothetical protein